MESNTTTVTLFDVLSSFWFYPFPHLGIFFLAAIPTEAYCIYKKGSKRISASLFILSMSAVLLCIYWSFSITTRSYSPGERIGVPSCYLLSCLGIAIVSCFLYFSGVAKEIKEKRIRVTALRAPIFFVILFLYSLSAYAPYRVERILEKFEPKPREVAGVGNG